MARFLSEDANPYEESNRIETRLTCPDPRRRLERSSTLYTRYSTEPYWSWDLMVPGKVMGPSSGGSSHSPLLVDGVGAGDSFLIEIERIDEPSRGLQNRKSVSPEHLRSCRSIREWTFPWMNSRPGRPYLPG